MTEKVRVAVIDIGSAVERAVAGMALAGLYMNDQPDMCAVDQSGEMILDVERRLDDPVDAVADDFEHEHSTIITPYGTVFCEVCEKTIKSLNTKDAKCRCGHLAYAEHNVKGKCLQCGKHCGLSS